MSSSESTATHDTTAALPVWPERGIGMPARGSVLGRYLVIEELGRGGMGLVVRAYDPKLQREVALKMLRHDVMSDEARIRMMREARAMAKLNHPNVVAIYDVSLEDNALALAMEYVPGTTLRHWLRQGSRSAAAIVAAFVQAGRGLAAAHAEGLLHRDFKPANVLVTENGDGRLRVKVTDFGIARVESQPELPIVSDDELPELLLSHSGESDTGALTEAGTVMGTPRYMAPEQHCGGPLGPAADQYAFCIALWESLVGDVPFSGDAMASRKLAGPPPWPRGVGAPPGVVAALRRGLAPSPDDRWPDMTALLQALAAKARRDRSRLTIAIVGGIVGVTGVGWAVWSERTERCTGAEAQLADVWNASRRAEVESALLAANATYAPALWERIGPRLDGYAQEWVAMHGDACLATSVRAEQSTAVLDLRMSCLHRAKRELAAALTLLDHADADVLRKAHVLIDNLPDLQRCADIDALSAEVPPPAPAEAEAVEEIETIVADARALRRAGKILAASDAIDSADAELVRVDYGPIATEVTRERAAVLALRGSYEAAEQAFRTAIALAGRSGQWTTLGEVAGEVASLLALHEARSAEAQVYLDIAQIMVDRSGDPAFVSALHSQRGTVLHAQGKYGEAEAEFRAAVELRARVLGPDDISVTSVRNNRAIALHHLGRYEEAEAEHRTVLQIRETNLGPEHPEVASSHHNLAATLNAEAKPDEAIAHYREALRIWEQALGPRSSEVMSSRTNLGNVFNGQGRYAEAEVLLRDVVEAEAAELGPEHPQITPARTNLANALLGLGRYDEAETEYRTVLRSELASRGPDHPEVAHARSNVAVVLAATNRQEDAETEFRAAIDTWTKTLGADHDDTMSTRSDLGRTLVALGRAAEGEAELRIALAGLERTMGVEHPAAAMTRQRLGLALARLGRFAEAEAEFRTALRIFARERDGNPELVETRLRFGAFLRERGELDEARALLDSAWTVLRENSRPIEHAEAAFELARVQWAQGERSEARALAREAERAFAAAGARWTARHAEVERWLHAPA